LANLLIDETGDGYQGPVDFRNIGVRDFGVVYEGLLESELSLAEQPLTIDNEGHYVPVDIDGQQTLGDDHEDIVVEEGEGLSSWSVRRAKSDGDVLYEISVR